MNFYLATIMGYQFTGCKVVKTKRQKRQDNTGLPKEIFRFQSLPAFKDGFLINNGERPTDSVDCT